MDDITKFGEYLRKNEARYLRAKDFINSPEYLTTQLDTLDKIKAVVPHKATTEIEAVWILGKLRQLIDDGLDAETTILQYESVKKSHGELLLRARK